MNEVAERIDAIERRLEEHAAGGPAPGLTEPDPGSSERWEAAQVWAHMAEFVSYWNEQARRVVADFTGEPVPFGRVKTDAGRIAAIEMGRHRPVAELADQARQALAGLHRFLDELGPADMTAVGRHQTVGAMSVERIIEHFVLDHLDEHLDQLHGLAGRRAGR